MNARMRAAAHSGYSGLLVLFLLAFLLHASACLRAQTAAEADSTLPGVPAARGAILQTSLPGDMRTEIWLTLRNGTVVIADRQNISLRGDDIEAHGPLAHASFPASAVRGFTVQTPAPGFRTTLVGSMLLAAVFMLSPKDATGGYIGSERLRGTSEFPGVSASGILLTAGLAVTAAAVVGSTGGDVVTIPLTGGEPPETWRQMLDDEAPQWHLRGDLALVFSNVQSTWRKQQERFSLEALDDPSVRGYAQLTIAPLNAARLLRAGWSPNRRYEFGVALQCDGVQRFYETARYVRPGNPPTTVLQDVSSDMSITSFFATAQYNVKSAPSSPMTISVGAGLGSANKSARLQGFNAGYFYADNSQHVEKGSLAAIVFASAEWAVDRSLSVGVTADYSITGSLDIPALKVTDYDGRVYRTLDAFSLGTSTFALGVSIGVHL